MKHWKIILIALLTALLVCCCMSAMAEDATYPGDLDHGPVEPHGPTHQTGVREVNVNITSHHSSRIPGMEGGWAVETYDLYCAICGTTVEQGLTREVYEACEWRKVEGTYKKATCTSDETEQWKCIRCGYEFTHVYSKALGHQWTSFVTPATCTKDGSKGQRCSRCSATQNVVSIPAMGHLESGHTVTIKELTCQQDGIVHVTCIRHEDSEGNPYNCDQGYHCGSWGYDKIIPRRGHLHLEDNWVVKFTPTCLKVGQEVNYCEYCGGDAQVREIPKVGHKWVSAGVITPATCTKDGLEELKCAFGCGARDEKVLPALGHDDSGEWTYDRACATCTEAMTGKLICARKGCNVVLDSKVFPAKGHNWQIMNSETHLPTCTQDGYALYKCENVFEDQFGQLHPCGEFKQVRLPASHKYEEKVTKAPTCTETGVKTLTCSVCGDQKETEIPALGHKPEVVVTKEPTETEPGERQTVCSVCGTVLATEEIPATGKAPEESTEPADPDDPSDDDPSTPSTPSTPSSSTPSTNLFSGVINAVGPTASALGATGTSMVTPIDLSVDGTYTYSLVADNQYVVGTLTVVVNAGSVTVSYAVNDATNIQITSESLTVYANGEALKAGTGTTAAFGAAYDAAGDTKVILAVSLTATFDVNGAGVYAYTPDQTAIDAMLALVD